MRKHLKAINLPTIDRLMHGGWRSIILGGKALEDLLSIEDTMRPLAPIGDDNLRGVWIYVRRGRPSDWYTVKEALEEEVIKAKEDYLKTWHDYYPDKGRWFFVETAHYKDAHWLYISDKAGDYCSLKSSGNNSDDRTFDVFVWFTEELLKVINEAVNSILSDASRYNAKVSKGLDYMQRMGRISRADYNKICPEDRVLPKDPERVIRIFKEIIEHPRASLPTMTIRQYCHYYKIACLAEKDHRTYLNYRKENLDFYKEGNFYHIPSGLLLDSEKSFEHFSRTSHFGELKCITARLGAKHLTPEGWMFYLAYETFFRLDEVMDIIVALYDAGAPLLVQDAEKLLAILEEKDYVLLYKDSDWRSAIGPQEGTCTSLPASYMCGIDGNITAEQKEALIRHADWLPVAAVLPDQSIPLGHPIYESIHSDVPRTVSQLIQMSNKLIQICFDPKYDTNGYFIWGDKKRFKTFNEAALVALGLANADATIKIVEHNSAESADYQ